MTYPIAQLERRFTAFAVDRILAWGLLALVGVLTVMFVSDDVWTVVGVVGGAMVLLWLVLAVVLGVGGTSPGKAMTGLRVVHHGTGTPIGVGPALLRSLVLGAAGLPTFGIGVATLAWTAVEDRSRQRRGWHDHLAHTVVVDVRPVAEVASAAAEEGPRHIVNLTAMRLVPAPPVEAVRTPERSEHSMRRQQLPPEVIAPPVAAPPAAGAAAGTSAGAAAGAAAAGAPAAAAADAPAGTAPAAAAPRRRRPSPARPVGPPARGGSTSTTARASSSPGWRWSGRRPEPRSGEQVAHLIPLASADMSVSKTHAQFGPGPRRHDRGDGPRVDQRHDPGAPGRLAPARRRQAGRAASTATRSSTATAR